MVCQLLKLLVLGLLKFGVGGQGLGWEKLGSLNF